MALASIGRSVEWMADRFAKHPARYVGAAAALGMYKAHPWRKVAGLGSLVGLPTAPWSTGSIVSEMFLGDPDARAKIMHAAIKQGIANGISPIGNASIPAQTGTRPYQYAPNGSIIFGMWNNRLK